MQKIILASLQLYQYFISPLFGPSCRFHPSCSNYAIEAIETHGSLRGGWMAIKRLLKCQPLCHGGVDPVPEKHRVKSLNIS